MMNKKGTTLIEVIISIALIAVVLSFMIKMLIELNADDTDSTYAKDNQINRAEILRAVNNDLNEHTLIDINDEGSNGSTLVINFLYNDGSRANITATATEFRFTNSVGEMRRWTMENCEIYIAVADMFLNKDANIYTLIINIEIHSFNERNDINNNNTLDDITISYIGNSSDYTGVSRRCLGNNC